MEETSPDQQKPPKPPGDPTPVELAAADQKYAAVRVFVDKLVAQAPRHTGSGTERWINFMYHDVIDAVVDLTGDDQELFETCGLGIAAEALIRLAAKA